MNDAHHDSVPIPPHRHKTAGDLARHLMSTARKGAIRTKDATTRSSPLGMRRLPGEYPTKPETFHPPRRFEHSRSRWGFARVTFWLGMVAICLAITLLEGKSTRAQTEEEHTVEHLSRTDVGPYRGGQSAELDDARKLIGEQTNAFRKSQGLDALTINDNLNATAQEFADYMARTDRYGHTADGRRPSERAVAHDYLYCQVAENIAYLFASEGFQTKELAEKAVTGWRKSPGHRRNMLKEHVTEMGTGLAQSKTTGINYAVQMFGRPRSAVITFEIANRGGRSFQYTLGDQSFTLPAEYTRQHQLCTPESLNAVKKEDDAESSKTDDAINPSDGDRFEVVEKDGRLMIKTVASQ